MAVSNLDIFAKVGKAAAHDELIPFTIESGQLLIGEDSSEFDGILTIEFSKVSSHKYTLEHTHTAD